MKTMPAAAEFRIELVDDGLVLKVDAGTPLLEGLRAAGAELRHACRNGVCEVCAAHLLSGEVWQRYPERRISAAEVDTPLILLCTSIARSDLRLNLTSYARRRR